MTSTENDPNMRQLQQLVRLTTQVARDNPGLFTTNVEDNHLPVPRVFATNSDDENRRIKRSMAPSDAQLYEQQSTLLRPRGTRDLIRPRPHVSPRLFQVAQGRAQKREPD